jgi:hypothetical protein
MTPTPPPPFKIIPKEYLLNGGTLPGDAIVSTETYPKFRPSVLAGTAAVHQCKGTKLALGRKTTWYASAQLDHPCFKWAPSGAQEATEIATDEPASMVQIAAESPARSMKQPYARCARRDSDQVSCILIPRKESTFARRAQV